MPAPPLTSSARIERLESWKHPCGFFQLVWLSFKLCPLCWAATVPAHSQQMVTPSSPLDACVLYYYITVPNAIRLAAGTGIQGCLSLVLQLTHTCWYVLNQVPRIQPSSSLHPGQLRPAWSGNPQHTSSWITPKIGQLSETRSLQRK